MYWLWKTSCNSNLKTKFVACRSSLDTTMQSFHLELHYQCQKLAFPSVSRFIARCHLRVPRRHQLQSSIIEMTLLWSSWCLWVYSNACNLMERLILVSLFSTRDSIHLIFGKRLCSLQGVWMVHSLPPILWCSSRWRRSSQSSQHRIFQCDFQETQ